MKTLLAIHLAIGLVWAFYQWGFNRERKHRTGFCVFGFVVALVAWELVFFVAFLLVAKDKGSQWARE